MTPVRRLAGVFLAGSLLAAAGCSAGGGGVVPAADGATASRAAGKRTCPDVDWEAPAALDVVQTGRELVGFSPTLLGVKSTWAGKDFTAETVAGGYVDDLTEAYDDLHLTGTLDLRSGVEAEVLHGRLLGDPVLVVVWRDPAEDVPCDVHALVASGADQTTEELILDGLR